MGYSNRGGYSRRRTYAVTSGRIPKVNKRAGNGHYCQEEIPAGGGQLWRNDDGSWSVVHVASEWSGSPVSGQYTGGCPEDTDKQNAAGKFGRDGVFTSERDAIARRSAIYASREAKPAPRAYSSSGARMSYRCTHEDYPCCGC